MQSLQFHELRIILRACWWLLRLLILSEQMFFVVGHKSVPVWHTLFCCHIFNTASSYSFALLCLAMSSGHGAFFVQNEKFFGEILDIQACIASAAKIAKK